LRCRTIRSRTLRAKRNETKRAGEANVDGCVFCKMVAGEIPVTRIYEDEAVLAFLDIGPLSEGHALVIPKRHCASVHECEPGVLAEVARRLGRIAGAVAKVVKAEGYNVLCNNGRAAGQVVDHVHFHIIPRRTGDRVFTEWRSHKYDKGRMEQIAAEIRKSMAQA
jgi:histidine triad (HIT) family protein